MLSLAQAKSRCLELANDAKTGNKAFSEKFTKITPLERHKQPLDLQARYVAVRVVTDRQTDTQNDCHNPVAHAPRVNNIHPGAVG